MARPYGKRTKRGIALFLLIEDSTCIAGVKIKGIEEQRGIELGAGTYREGHGACHPHRSRRRHGIPITNFGEYGRVWLQSPAKTRIERLLVEYGPEFPEEIAPEPYAQLSAAFHAVKRTAWARS